MNIRKIVTYNNLRRQFTPEELVFANELYDASETDRQLLIEALQPAKSTTKKKRNRATKTPRASSIQQAIAGTGTGRGAVVLCDFEVDGKVCHGEPGDGIHDHAMGYSGYHEFQVPLASAAGGD